MTPSVRSSPHGTGGASAEAVNVAPRHTHQPFLRKRPAKRAGIFLRGGLGGHFVWPLTVLAPCLIWLCLHSPALNAMALGNETVATLDLNAGLAAFVAAAMITAVMVAFFRKRC